MHFVYWFNLPVLEVQKSIGETVTCTLLSVGRMACFIPYRFYFLIQRIMTEFPVGPILQHSLLHVLVDFFNGRF